MTFISESPNSGKTVDRNRSEIVEPRVTANGVCVTIHGHFYQPPRENPYLDAIERQPGAAPFHNWNERIYHECYRPNAFARIFNDRGELVGIVNNYEYLSFNIGPTLMTWLEAYDRQVYEKILEADRKSCERLNGHGNAIAQAYNHIILPLANERDKYTQIRWGIEDFRSRFGRDPEGMWLAEAAVDYPTLDALVAEGIKFIVLAPSQVERCRSMPTESDPHPEWHAVGGGQIDPTRPYRCYLKTQPDAYIDIFFYDGPISRDMGFNDVLESSHNFAGRLGLAVRGDFRPAQLISVATDGETFGHHKQGKEKCLAYCFSREFPQRGWTVTNFAHYLALNPPTWECELKSVTAWSCAHGVDRWQDDCGCGGGGEWHQKWRRPLRDSLNWLRDRLVEIYEAEGRRLLTDPWQARDEYVEVILDRRPETIEGFLERHQTHPLDESERVDALRVLEMQRHSLLMFTSCGWFFEELSRPEGVQILRYAARAIELAGEVNGVDLEPEFIDRIAQAPSNVVKMFADGADVYRKRVKTSQISIDRVAAHYAISSLFTTYGERGRVYCYDTHQIDYQLQRLGVLTLAVGQLQLTSVVTQETARLVFGVLHLGGLDFHCCIQPFSNRLAYTQLKQTLLDTLQNASAAQIVLAMNEYFDGESFGPQDLFAEERQRIVQLLNQETLGRLDRLYSQVYRENYSILVAFHQNELPVPQELQVAAEIALGQRCLETVRALDRELDETTDAPSWGQSHLAELEAIATEASHLRCHLKVPEATQILERLILRSLWHLLHEENSIQGVAQARFIERAIAASKQLQLEVCLDRAQELYFVWLHGQVGDWVLSSEAMVPIESENQSVPASQIDWSAPQLLHLLQLGQCLKVDVSPWLG
ncbi:MAG: DUF3536 domain-containing protein [Cyanobacteriota bacterium]|nr:DUF3536 domain-containing protein [Cyanobacteriota bacterium]